jgi:NADH-quinone oxidoreductase subunit D
MDLGAQTVFMYTAREREIILSIFELVSGVRMMTSFLRIGGLAADVPSEFDTAVADFVRIMPGKIDEYELLLTRNPIFTDRTKGIGKIGREDALRYGFTGPCLRASDVQFDVRVEFPYSGYEEYDFDVPYSREGDVYARYLVRVREMRESVRIIEQGLRKLRETNGGEIRIDNPRIAFPKREKIHTSMESLIHHFKLVSEGPIPRPGEAYAAVESPKGEFGVYVFSDGSNKPFRVRFRPACLYNLQALPRITDGGLMADVVACIGSIDIVLGEVDR